MTRKKEVTSANEDQYLFLYYKELYKNQNFCMQHKNIAFHIWS